MKKTITVNLSGQVFTLDDDAYEALQNYLNDIKKYFSDEVSDQEVIKDIESSIAEKFSAKLVKGKQVININDVEELIKVMGTVDDIIEDDKANGKETHSDIKTKHSGEKYRTGKRLFRNTDDTVIAGVCSGLAAFFGVDPVIVRLLFGISIFFGGAGIILYLILWIVMPPAKSSTEKLEMQGVSVTLEGIEEAAKAKSKKLKEMDTSGIRRAFALPFKFIGELFKGIGRLSGKFGKFILSFLGIVIVVVSVLTMTMLGFIAAAMVFNYDSPYIVSDIPFADIIAGPLLILGTVAALLVVLVPIFFILLLGATMVDRKSAFSAPTNSVLIGIWMVAIITFGVVALDVAPDIQTRIEEHSDYTVVEKDFDYSDFNSLLVMSNHHVNIVPGEFYSIHARGRDKDIERLELKVNDQRLDIRNKRQEGICLFCFTNKGVEFEITMPELLEVVAPGAAEINTSGFSGDKIRLEITGASRMEADTDYLNYTIRLTGASRLDLVSSTSDEILINESGASYLELSGEGKKLKAEISGASKLKGYSIEIENADLEISGASIAELSVSDTIEVNASGASKLYYQGEPEIIKDLSGSSRLIQE